MGRTTTISFALIAVALSSTACSRHKAAAAAPIPVRGAVSDPASVDALNRANADADRARTEAAEKERADKITAIKGTLTTPVFFQFDHSDLTDEGIQLLDAKVEALQTNPSIRIRIEGNADDAGSDEYNMALSQRRAAIVNRYFNERGIDASRLQIVSYGEERPTCTTNREEPCRALNRRDNFVILSGL